MRHTETVDALTFTIRQSAGRDYNTWLAYDGSVHCERFSHTTVVERNSFTVNDHKLTEGSDRAYSGPEQAEIDKWMEQSRSRGFR